GGSLYGFGYDEYFYDDSLTLDEIDSALSNVKDKQDVTYEVVGFDACLMATLETAKMLEPYANYLIASEETEPDYGWDYTRIFSDLSNGLATDGESFGEIVVSGFMVDSIDKNAEEMLTLSVIDLSKITAVVDSVDALFAAIGTNSYEYGYDSLSKVIPQKKAFVGNTEYSGYTDHYDLENLAKKLTEFWPGEANAVMTAIDDAVVYKIAGYLATDAGGISLYLPYYDLYVDDISAAYDPVSFSTGYADFVSDYVDYRLDTFTNNTDFDYVLNTEVDPYQITFGPEYIDYISALYLNVYIVDDTVDGYYYTDLGMDAWVYPTDDPYTWEEGFYRWASLGDWYVPLFVTYENDDYIEYETPILLNGEYVTLVSAWVYDEDSYIVYGARPSIESGGGIQDRNTIEFEEGDEIILLYDIYDMNSSEVYESYSDPYYVDASGVPRFEDFDFGTGFTYAVQFVIQDYNGTYTYTEPLEFSYDD
nr:clostripain-related cysteine peptidase [Vallitaleaceae bacterium]